MERPYRWIEGVLACALGATTLGCAVTALEPQRVLPTVRLQDPSEPERTEPVERNCDPEGPVGERCAVAVLELGGGAVAVADPDGRLRDSSVDGGRFALRGGVLIGNGTSAMGGMGAQFPAVTLDEASSKYNAPAGDYSSMLIDFDFSVRHAFRGILGQLEPVIGLALHTRVLALSYNHPSSVDESAEESDVSGTQFGLAIAPILGFQWVASGAAGRARVLPFVEVSPEATTWLTGTEIDETNGELPEAPAAMRLFQRVGEAPSLQFAVVTGLRFEM